MKASTTRHTNCEKDFVLKSINKGIRLDGRQAFDYRNIDIKFGVDYGCCEVTLGDTKVLAQTSSEIVKPRETRPTEGQLFLNCDLSPLASSAYEAGGRMGDYGVEINRLVERCLKESRPIDVESLCIVAGEKVWDIRVDILLLNDSGNILDCCCIAAIASLSHFQRPDITVSGNDIIIHTMEEREPLPLNVHHMPICTTFGFIEDGKQIIVDPEEKEESIISGKLIMAFNVHGEVCCAQMSGGVSLEYEQIMQCAKIASIKAVEINDLIKEGLEVDKIRRAPVTVKRREGLKDPPNINLITNTKVDATDVEIPSEVKVELEEPSAEKQQIVERLGCGIAAIGNGGYNSWIMDDDSDDSDCGGLYKPTPMNKVDIKTEVIDDDEDSNSVVILNDNYKNPSKIKIEDEDSEEEVVVLNPNELDMCNKINDENISLDNTQQEKDILSPDVYLSRELGKSPNSKKKRKKKKKKNEVVS